MRKRFLIGGIGAVIIALCLVQFQSWMQHRREHGARITENDIALAGAKLGRPPIPQQTALPLPAPLKLAETVRLAIGSLGLENDEENARIADVALAKLGGTPGLEMVERQSFQSVLGELNLTLSGLVRAKDAVRVGKIIRADWFLLGTPLRLDGTNSLVLRMVDTRTGCLLDAVVLPVGPDMVRIAEGLAAFARKCRANAAAAKVPVYLAIGTIEDVGVNDRLAGFPAQLRSYLTAAYQGDKVILLEREYVDALLQEVTLDLAGLSEGGSNASQRQMRSAFWLVSGDYQSYETTDKEVELELMVDQVFGLETNMAFRGPVGPPLLRQVKAAIDAAMTRPANRPWSRTSEVHWQMKSGSELADFSARFGAGSDINLIMNQYSYDPQTAARDRRNIGEAIRAFQTVLLLDPTNRAAKVRLAACLRKPVINRPDEARDYYRQIIEDPVQDKWTGVAQKALVESWAYTDPNQRALWYGRAEMQNTNSPVAQFYHQQAEQARQDVLLSGHDSKAHQIALQRFHEAIRANNSFSGTYFPHFGMDDYVNDLAETPDQAARTLAEDLPRLQMDFPRIAPHLLAGVVCFQVDTNAAVVSEFEHSLSNTVEHVNDFPTPYYCARYWEFLRSVVEWASGKKDQALMLEVLAQMQRAANHGHPEALGSTEKMDLAFLYQQAGEWKAALELFDTYSNLPVLIPNNGVWGKGPRMIATGRHSAQCRAKLGLPDIRQCPEFQMETDGYYWCEIPYTFAVDPGGVWLGCANQLIHLDFNLQTNFVVQLPNSPVTTVKSLCLTPSSIWAGTSGGGLIEVDRDTKTCRHWTMHDGLLMDAITALDVANNTLWIGYGSRTYEDVYATGVGGLGKMDLATHHFTSFPLPLAAGNNVHLHTYSNTETEPDDGPTGRAVMAICATANDEVWFATLSQPLRRYVSHQGKWEGFRHIFNTSSLAANGGSLVETMDGGDLYASVSGPPGVRLFDVHDGQWREAKESNVLPAHAATAVHLSADHLWIGGRGYLALFGLKDLQPRKFAYLGAAVDHIEEGGGFVWAQYGGRLSKALVADSAP
jgi:hypothetical protein